MTNLNKILTVMLLSAGMVFEVGASAGDHSCSADASQAEGQEWVPNLANSEDLKKVMQYLKSLKFEINNHRVLKATMGEMGVTESDSGVLEYLELDTPEFLSKLDSLIKDLTDLQLSASKVKGSDHKYVELNQRLEVIRAAQVAAESRAQN